MSLRHTVSRLSFAVCLWTAAGCSTPSADEHIVRADAFKQRGLLQEAVIEYRSAIRLAPQRGDARMKLADVYLETRDSGAALREYVRAADLMPENPTVQIQAGSLLLLAGAFEDAQTRAARSRRLPA